MDLSEISERISNSRTSSFLVDKRQWDDFPGYERKVELRMSNKVAVSFNIQGENVGGATFLANFPTINSAINSLENYLSMPISKWKDIVDQDSDGEKKTTINLDASHLLLADAIEKRKIPLPLGEFGLITSHWNFYKEYFFEQKSAIDLAISSANPFKLLKRHVLGLSAKGLTRKHIEGIYLAAHSKFLRDGVPEDVIADILDGIANSFAPGSPNNLELPD
jgi:hypothetical protein